MKLHRGFVDGGLQRLVVVGERGELERAAGRVRSVGRGAQREQEARGEGGSSAEGLAAAAGALGHHHRPVARTALREGRRRQGRRGQERRGRARDRREDQERAPHCLMCGLSVAGSWSRS